MKYVGGDLLQLAREGQFDVIAHGCNCFCTFGAGLAKSIKEQFPQAYQADLQTRPGDRSKLGGLTQCEIHCETHSFIIANLYTQYFWGRARSTKDSQEERYQAIEQALMKLAASTNPDARVGLPRLGAGLAGGDWAKISTIIESIIPCAQIVIPARSQ